MQHLHIPLPSLAEQQIESDQDLNDIDAVWQVLIAAAQHGDLKSLAHALHDLSGWPIEELDQYQVQQLLHHKPEIIAALLSSVKHDWLTDGTVYGICVDISELGAAWPELDVIQRSLRPALRETKLTHRDPVERWITVFKNSSHPKFAGKTAEQREKMARAAQYRAVKNFNPYAQPKAVKENMRHDRDSDAVPELKAALLARKLQLRKMQRRPDELYDVIDDIMTTVAKTHGISGQRLHDLWVAQYHEVPDAWIQQDHSDHRSADHTELHEGRAQEIVHHNPSIATLKALARNNKYHSVRFVIYKDGSVVAADSEHFTHQSMAPAMGAWDVRGYVQYLGDNDYAYRSLELYSGLTKDHPLLRRWEQAGIENGNGSVVEENLRDWFKQKWVRFGPDGKIRGACARGSDREGKPKCLPQAQAHALGKKKRATAARRKRRQDPDADRRGAAKNVRTKESITEDSALSAATRRVQRLLNDRFGANLDIDGILGPLTLQSINRFMPQAGFGPAPDPTRTTAVQGLQIKRMPTDTCPHCGGEMYEASQMSEKQDACYYKVKSRYRVWPSAYASGALVQCRKKGAKNWGKHKAKESQHTSSDQLKETREAALKWLKSYLPAWPDYVLRDWMYNHLRGDWDASGDDPKTVIQRTLDGEGMTPQTRWKFVPDFHFTFDSLDPDTVRRIKERQGGAVNPYGIPQDAERHATQATLAAQQGGVRDEPVILKKVGNQYELIEGWHRTIQHFKQFPNGYKGPAWIAIDAKPVSENFADGRGPGRKGDSQRHGIPKNATIAQLEKAAKSKGRRGQLARWQINMRRGKKNESLQELSTAREVSPIIKTNELFESVSGDSMWKIIQQTHHEPIRNPAMKKFIKSHQWSLEMIGPQGLTPEEKLFDRDDPFDRVIDIDTDRVIWIVDHWKAGRVPAPIVMGPEGSVIDGNHRAQAAIQLNRPIQAYMPRPVKPIKEQVWDQTNCETDHQQDQGVAPNNPNAKPPSGKISLQELFRSIQPPNDVQIELTMEMMDQKRWRITRDSQMWELGMAQSDISGIWEVAFSSMNGSKTFDLTGKGSAPQVFAAVGATLYQEAKSNPLVQGFVFTGKEPSQKRLYTVLTQRLSEALGWENDPAIGKWCIWPAHNAQVFCIMTREKLEYVKSRLQMPDNPEP